MRGGDRVAAEATLPQMSFVSVQQMFSQDRIREAHWARLDRWRHEARGADPVKRRCARFYLSQTRGGPVIPT